MSKKIKLKNSTLLLIGLLLIISGVVLGSLDYLKSKKDKAFSEMNILLYQSETPGTIESEEEIELKRTEDNPQTEPNLEPEPINYDYIGILEIPKIYVKRGFLDISSIYNNVDYNITVIQGSTFPDVENNNLILAAHSGYCSICFFDNLYKLDLNDEAYVYYQGVKYSYKIVKIYEVEKTGTVAIYRNYNKNTVTRITCTRGSDTKQNVYILELYNKEDY